MYTVLLRLGELSEVSYLTASYLIPYQVRDVY